MSVLADSPEAASAIAYCRQITRRQARNFYYGLRLLPEPQRSALYCIYAWMRRADDIADDAVDAAVAAAQLDAFAAMTHRVLDGATDLDDPLWHAFDATVRRFKLSPDFFDAMIDGQRADLAFQQPQTLEDLLRYCRQVASSVGRVCVTIWGADDARAMTLADDRGIAFQLTNILRDVREDAGRGRVYLPADLLDEHGLSIDAILRWTQPESCAALIGSLVGTARHHYESSHPLDAMITPACRPTLVAMTRIYRGLLDRIEPQPEIIVGPRRVRLGRLRKLSIAISARMQARST